MLIFEKFTNRKPKSELSLALRKEATNKRKSRKVNRELKRSAN